MPNLTVGTENGHPVEIAFSDVGSGQPVVLIHGWPLSSRSWEPQVAALVEAGHRVVAYDRRGFGASSQPWHGYDYDTFTADLAALVEHLDLREAVLVGFSMGGGEVARYAARQGRERVAKVVFASAVTPYLYAAPDNPDGGLDDATIESLLAGVRGDRMGFFDGFYDAFFGAGGRLMVSPQQKAYALGLTAVASPKATADCILAWARTDFRADLAAVTVPALVIHGDADATVPLEVSGQRTAAAIEGAELVVIPDGPHGVTVSHAEQWNAAVLEFLAR